MKKIFILFMALSSSIAYAQQSKPAPTTKKKLIGINFSPDYDFRTLSNKDGSASGDLVIKSRNDNEMAKFGFTAGLSLCIDFSTPVQLETGIQYSNKGYQTKNTGLIYFPPNPALPTKAKFIYNYQYIGIPLKARFIFGKTNVLFLSSIGFMTNFLIKAGNTTIYEYADGRTDKKKQSATADFNKIDISPMISSGIDYKINNNTHFIAEAVFRYGILKTKDAPVSERLWNAGLNIGCYFKLR
jgi:hypothetical protein